MVIVLDLSHVKTLEDFYSEIVSGQVAVHGENFCSHHDLIRDNLTENDIYIELGTQQGGSAAAAMLCKPKKVILVDISMEKYNEYLKPIAENYCQNNGIELVLKEISSIDTKSAEKADVMLIDTVHTSEHMQKELAIHGDNISKVIIAHDTSIVNKRKNEALYHCLMDFCGKKGWELQKRNTNNVGSTSIERGDT